MKFHQRPLTIPPIKTSSGSLSTLIITQAYLVSSAYFGKEHTSSKFLGQLFERACRVMNFEYSHHSKSAPIEGRAVNLNYAKLLQKVQHSSRPQPVAPMSRPFSSCIRPRPPTATLRHQNRPSTSARCHRIRPNSAHCFRTTTLKPTCTPLAQNSSGRKLAPTKKRAAVRHKSELHHGKWYCAYRSTYSVKYAKNIVKVLVFMSKSSTDIKIKLCNIKGRAIARTIYITKPDLYKLTGFHISSVQMDPSLEAVVGKLLEKTINIERELFPTKFTASLKIQVAVRTWLQKKQQTLKVTTNVKNSVITRATEETLIDKAAQFENQKHQVAACTLQSWYANCRIQKCLLLNLKQQEKTAATLINVVHHQVKVEGALQIQALWRMHAVRQQLPST